MFQPFRRRLQTFIDWRFYHCTYGEEKPLAVVQETLQPAQVSLWLRQPERHSKESFAHLEPYRSTPSKAR